MRRIAWATDIHLEFCTDARVDAFCADVRRAAPDALLLGGDIGQSHTVVPFLRRLARAVHCPIYFVLGNHDYYHGSIAQVRSALAELESLDTALTWLPEAGVVPLSAATALVSIDGWSDGRLGDFFASPVQLHDYLLIRDLTLLTTEQRFARLNQLGDAEAARLRDSLRAAFSTHERVMVLTHVPPFAESAWHEGKQSDDDWLPHFSSKAAGDVLLAAADENPDRDILVLCGHTHGAGTVQMRPNLRVVTGGAEYGQPALQEIIDVA